MTWKADGAIRISRPAEKESPAIEVADIRSETVASSQMKMFVQISMQERNAVTKKQRLVAVL